MSFNLPGMYLYSLSRDNLAPEEYERIISPHAAWARICREYEFDDSHNTRRYLINMREREQRFSPDQARPNGIREKEKLEKLKSISAKKRESIGRHSATSSLQSSKLNDYYRQAEKYGQGGIKELENGRFRFYGTMTPARTSGEMAGARLVREWAPKSGQTRTWYETVDHSGNIRSVAPKPVVNDKNHRIFDTNGNYQGRR